MFDDILKEKRFIICTVTGCKRYLLPGRDRCSSWEEHGCRKYMVTGEFDCKERE